MTSFMIFQLKLRPPPVLVLALVVSAIAEEELSIVWVLVDLTGYKGLLESYCMSPHLPLIQALKEKTLIQILKISTKFLSDVFSFWLKNCQLPLWTFWG